MPKDDQTRAGCGTRDRERDAVGVHSHRHRRTGQFEHLDHAWRTRVGEIHAGQSSAGLQVGDGGVGRSARGAGFGDESESAVGRRGDRHRRALHRVGNSNRSERRPRFTKRQLHDRQQVRRALIDRRKNPVNKRLGRQISIGDHQQ